MAKTLNKTMIRALPTPAKGYTLTYFAGHTVDGYMVPVGFAVRVMASGARSFLLCYQDAARKPHRNTLGQFPKMRLAAAIREAAKQRLAIDGGAVITPRHAAKAKPPAAPVTVNDVLDDWTKRKGGGLRTLQHYEGAFRRYIRPALGAIPVMELRKAPIREMVDDIRDGVGPIMANKALGCLASVLNWYAGQVDDFVPPVLKGLRGEAVARSRKLGADEIAVLWPTFEASVVYGALCRVLLLTGQRRSDIAEAHWSEIAEGEARGRDAVACEGATLTIPAARYKTARDHTVPLSAPVRELLASLPGVPGTDRLFPALNFSLSKTRLDALAPGIAHWTLHDLRRTATSLMIEARVRPDYVERVTHPEIAGVAGVYNRYAYLDEKTEALDALAAMVDRIVNPAPAGNVVSLRSR
jgi:integrase